MVLHELVVYALGVLKHIVSKKSYKKIDKIHKDFELYQVFQLFQCTQYKYITRKKNRYILVWRY